MIEQRWPTWSLPQVLEERPRIRINQLGYLPDGPKLATWISDIPEPVEFTVRRRDGSPVLRALSEPWAIRPDQSSGLLVQVLNFSALTGPGEDYRIVAGDDVSHPFPIRQQVYRPLARDALALFYLLRSGCPIDARRAPGYGRPAGHAGVPPNRGDAAVPGWTGADAQRLYPGWCPSGTFDVSGGWYDAGDYGKYTVSGSVALWQLLTLLDLLRGRPLPGAVEQATVIDECRWQLDWLLRMQVPPGQPLAGMASHRVHGTTWSPLPGWAHEDPTPRVLHRPSTAATLHLAAVAACAARILRTVDAQYAHRLLGAAETAHHAAQVHPALVAPDDQGRFGGGPYGDRHLDDDFYWAAVELWLATGGQHYREQFATSPQHTGDAFPLTGFDFDQVAAIARLDLATNGRRLADHDRVVNTVRDAAYRLLRLQQRQPWGQPYAPPEGWAWGSNGRLLNNLVLLATAQQLTGDRRLRDAAVTGIDYLLGRNALGQSYITGYGTDATRHVRTRQFGHDLDPAMPSPPPGAVAGGATSQLTPGYPSDPRIAGLAPQLCYLDEPTSETTNDICIRWNAPLVYIASYLSSDIRD